MHSVFSNFKYNSKTIPYNLDIFTGAEKPKNVAQNMRLRLNFKRVSADIQLAIYQTHFGLILIPQICAGKQI